MDHDVIVEQVLDRCKALSENILQAPDLQSVAPASPALFAQMREVARESLQAKITLEARQRRSQDVARCCPDANVKYVHTRAVNPETLFGQLTIAVRPFPCRGWGATFRPDDVPLGVPEAGDFTDAGRSLYAPVVAELPHRVANDLLQRCTGVALSSRGAQGIIDSTAEDLRTWQAVPERQETAAVEDALGGGDTRAERRLEAALDGVMAHIDGRWQAAKGGTLLVRRLEAEAKEPTLGVILARRDIGVRGSAEDLAVRLTQVIRAAGWAHSPVGEILGDGAAWMWKVADAHVPGVRQTRDDYHLSEHFDDFAPLLYPNSPAGAKAWVDQKLGALLTDRITEVLGALKRMRPWQQVLCDALSQLIGYVERNRSRIRYQEPWHRGLAVGAGTVEGACEHVMHRRFKRAGMPWKPPGFLHVLALRLASLNGTFQAFWASRGLVVQTSVGPTESRHTRALQNVLPRLPVVAGPLEGDRSAPTRQQPISARAHINGHRPTGADRLAPAALPSRDQHPGPHCLLVHVHAGAPLVHDLHSHLRGKGSRLAWRPDTSDPDVRAQGRPVAVPAGTPGPTAGQARGTTITNDLGANRTAAVLSHVHAWW